MEENKLSTIQIEVPYRGPGNIVVNKPVQFDVLQADGYYRAVPLLNTSERALANLPPELSFQHQNGKAISTRGIKDGNLHVIQDIVNALKAQNVLSS